MPTFVLQSVIPLLFLLSMPWLDRKRVLLAWPLTHLPDFDYLIGYHRATGHNVFLVLPFVALAGWGWRRARPELAQWGFIGVVYVGSHLAMDAFAGGVTLLYPFSLHTTCYYAEIDVVTATNTPFLDAGRCSYEGIPVVATVYTWLPTSDAAILAFIIPATLAIVAWRAWRRRKAASLTGS
ncbi:MAG TPA: metal-dependent hydrolase [Candidatus Thermoplasmatota archaeon]|nr:metal-dependent hydrolase [Candidatus Thermoplasmatota archaeon]